MGFPGGSDGKEAACNAGDLDSIPGLRRSPGEGNGNPLQYSCLENPMVRGAWWATVHGVAKSRTQLSDFHLIMLKEGWKMWGERGTFLCWVINYVNKFLFIRIVEWVTVPFSRGSSQPRDRTQVSCIVGRRFTL